MSDPVPATLVRDRFTWLCYLMLAYFAFLQAAIGPLMPFLRTELAFSYTVGALHLSAFACGAIATGLTAGRLTRRYGRPVLFWGGAIGMAVGVLALVTGRHMMWTITSVLVMGYSGTMLLTTLQATLAQKHGEQRATALSEANVAASIAATLAPLLVGGFQQAGAGWRVGLLVALLLLGLLFAIFHREPVPAARPVGGGRGGDLPALPPLFWAYWTLLCLCAAVEWCLIFWSAEYLVSGVGLQKATASTLVSTFFMAMVLGRVAGSRLTRYHTADRLLLWALLLTALGFSLFWLSPHAVFNVAGLFLAGLGVANLFPLTLALAVGVEPARADEASARLLFGVGIATVLAPLLVGRVADALSVQSALSLVALLLVAAFAAFRAARYFSHAALPGYMAEPTE